MSDPADRPLYEQHLADLAKSGLTADDARSHGWYSTADPAEVARLLNWKPGPAVERLGPCLVFPHPGADGHAVLKPDRPRAVGGKPIKYESPRGVPPRVYVPPGTLATLDTPATFLLLTEGVKKSAAADNHGFPCLGLAGVWNWQEKRPAAKGRKGKAGPRKLVPDLTRVAWRGRLVFVVFDSDAATNPSVKQAETHLAAALRKVGATVVVVRLPAGPDGAKVGLDDYLVAQGPDALRKLLDETRGKAGGEDADAPTDFGAALFADKDRLREVAALKLDDPAGYARERAKLKRRRVSVRDLDKAIEGHLQDIRAERLAKAAADPSSAPADPLPYYVSGGRLCRRTLTRDGEVETPLTNFDARIEADVLVDDGAERRRTFRVSGRLADGTPLPAAEIPADQFGLMLWPAAEWGTRATVYAGAGTKDHTRVALQLLSGDVARETVYAHTGWREIDGRWAYLHGGGAVGADGPVAGVKVALPGPLAGYVLPDPPAGDRLRAAVRASLGVLDGVAPDEVMVPLLVAAYRAVLGGADATVALIGRTGYGKTEAAALAQQHYGPGLDARNLPASWRSTANAIGEQMFAAKDALLCIDDYQSDGADPNALRRQADAVLRGAGNHSGRHRLTRDGRLRPDRPPRCLPLVTGEDVPGGASARARTWVVEISRAVDWKRLTECQRDAAAGLYAESLAGFVKWVADDYPGRVASFRADAVRLRAELGKAGGHARTPAAGADLLAGLAVLLQYAGFAGAVTPAEVDALWVRGLAAVRATAAAQADHLKDADPVERFPALVRAVLSSGRGHLAGPDGGRPDEHHLAAGWQSSGDQWRPLGRLVGWIDGERVYLDPDAALAEVVKLASEQGGGFAVSPRTLWRRLHESGRLAEVDRRNIRVRYTVRKVLAGAQRACVVFAADLLSADTSVHCVQSDANPSSDNHIAMDTAQDTGHNGCVHRPNGHSAAKSRVSSVHRRAATAEPQVPVRPTASNDDGHDGHNGHSPGVERHPAGKHHAHADTPALESEGVEWQD